MREVETINFEPPPPPPPAEEPETEQPEFTPPAITTVSEIPDSTRVPIPKAQVPMNITAPVENFFTDVAPAPLPTPPKPATPKKSSYSKPFFKKQPNYSKPKPAAVAKSHYSPSELDSTPRLLRHGSTSFPSSLSRKGINKGTVVFEVEISTSGRVSIRRTVSSTHPELISCARKVASGSRFTAPKRKGQPVKAIMRWPIVIQK